MWVTKQGKVSRADIVESECAALDEHALDAARLWTFIPAVQNNVPVPMWVATEFQFKADNK